MMYPSQEEMSEMPMHELLIIREQARKDDSGEAWQFRYWLIKEELSRL